MSILHAILLGILQGLTEFLPVSSSGHLAIAQHFLPGFEQPGVLFDVLLHVGTILAVLIAFRRDIWQLARAPFVRGEDARVGRRMLLLLVAGSVPTAIIGLTFKDFFVSMFERITVVAAMLLVTGALLLWANWMQKRDGRKAERLTLWDALLTGIAQGCAVMPGISRSGATIAALLLRGVDGETAARFSFLLALPAVGGAALLSLKDLPPGAFTDLPAYLAGMAAAFITGLLAIRWLLGVVRRRRLAGFALYCWLVGGALLCTL